MPLFHLTTTVTYETSASSNAEHKNVDESMQDRKKRPKLPPLSTKMLTSMQDRKKRPKLAPPSLSPLPHNKSCGKKSKRTDKNEHWKQQQNERKWRDEDTTGTFGMCRAGRWRAGWQAGRRVNILQHTTSHELVFLNAKSVQNCYWDI